MQMTKLNEWRFNNNQTATEIETKVNTHFNHCEINILLVFFNVFL